MYVCIYYVYVMYIYMQLNGSVNGLKSRKYIYIYIYIYIYNRTEAFEMIRKVCPFEKCVFITYLCVCIYAYI